MGNTYSEQCGCCGNLFPDTNEDCYCPECAECHKRHLTALREKAQAVVDAKEAEKNLGCHCKLCEELNTGCFRVDETIDALASALRKERDDG